MRFNNKPKDKHLTTQKIKSLPWFEIGLIGVIVGMIAIFALVWSMGERPVKVTSSVYHPEQTKTFKVQHATLVDDDTTVTHKQGGTALQDYLAKKEVADEF